MKNNSIRSLFLCLIIFLLTGCASSKKATAVSAKTESKTAVPAQQALTIRVKQKNDTYDLIEVPWEDFGFSWSYMMYVRPNYPAGVAKDIYDKIWTCYVKTIERGDYDYEAYNKRNEGDPNWSTPIEYKDDPSFRFHGVCYQYADYFEMLLKKEPILISLIEKGILRSESAPTHKYWVYQEPNGIKYYIDPTWGDWTVYGTPKGDFANNLKHERIIEQSPVRNLLVEAEMREWFFVQANAIGARSETTRDWDRSRHNLK
jgi:hypothetical protein